MARKIRDAMRASLISEKDAIQRRFEVAENIVALTEAKKGRGPSNPSQGSLAPEPQPASIGEVQPKEPEPQAPAANSLQRHESSAEKPVSHTRPKQLRLKAVRRTISITEQELKTIDSLKRKCFTQGQGTSQSELIRAGLQLLDQLKKEDLLELIASLPKLPRGKPVDIS